MTSGRNSRLSAVRDTVPPSRARYPWPRPYPLRWFSVYAPSWNRAPHDRSKRWSGQRDFRVNNQRRRIRPTLDHDRQHRVLRPSAPFREATTTFPDWLPASRLPRSSRDHHGGSYSSRTAFSGYRTVLYVDPVTTPF